MQLFRSLAALTEAGGFETLADQTAYGAQNQKETIQYMQKKIKIK